MKPFQKIYSWIDKNDSLLFLIFLVLVIFVFSPLHAHNPGYSIFLQIAFSCLLITGVNSLPKNRILRLCAWVLVFLTLAGRWANEFTTDSYALFLFKTIITLTFLLMMIIVVLYHVFSPGRINKSRIEFAISGYLLIGLFWAKVYILIECLIPGSLLIGGVTIDPVNMDNFVFFSFSTLTTVGYGDITATLPISRSIAMAEALIGMLYPVILLGRLVSLPHDSWR